jgi:N-acetylglutamate synthase-like GNAT family acetyltransferase
MRKRYLFTNRMKRIIKLSSQISNQDVIYPHHLFVAACQEATGVCAELHLYLYKKLGPDYIKVILSKDQSKIEESIIYYDELKLSKSTITVFEKAFEEKELYNQVLINEGHILQSIFMTDDHIGSILDRGMVEDIVKIACVPRDLIVHLKSYHSNSLDSYQNPIRRATHSDLHNLKQFIREEFGERWLKHIEPLQIKDSLPIFIAENKGAIIGFACFDTVENKKGLFGPMGTSSSKRLNDIGKELLLRSLTEMANIGYEYAIIGQAGPIEFYERVCNAQLIPKFN